MLPARSNADAGSISKIDAICDFLEVYIHAILYSRNVYPKTFFEDRYAYGIPVKASRHPELNQYVVDLIAAIKLELLKCESPGDIRIDIIDDNDAALESFVLELSAISGNYIAKHDIALRDTLIRTNNLEPADPSKSVSFRAGYRPRDGNPPSLEKSVWVGQIAGPPAEAAHEPRLIPLGTVDSADLKIQAFALLRKG